MALGRGTPEQRFDGRGIFFWQRAPRVSSSSAPRRYRMGNLVECLHGATAVVRSRPEPSLFRSARVIVCVRPGLDAHSRELLRACRRAGSFLVADFDDLLFEGDIEDWPEVIHGQLTKEQARERLARYRDGLQSFDAFTAATAVLAERLRVVTNGGRVALVPNGVSPQWLAQGRALYAADGPRAKVLRYLPGSVHDHDFAIAGEALGRFMRRHEDVRLEVLGPFSANTGTIPRERLTRLPRVPFEHLPHFLTTTWLTLAPLVDNPFNRAKSALKFLESAAFGTPCIASSIPDMCAHEAAGVLLADTTDQWESALERAYDESTRHSLGERSRLWVEQNGMATRSANAFLDAVGGWLG